MYVDIVDGPEDDMALLIGRHGQTLEAIQELTRMVVGRRLDERIRVIVDVEDYRKRRESKLEEQRQGAGRAGRCDSGREEELEPMNAFERKLVHDAVAGGARRGERLARRGAQSLRGHPHALNRPPRPSRRRVSRET